MHNCPDCHHELTEVTFTSLRAGKIHCWYCNGCGGSFFDHWDSNLLSLEEIKKELERVFFQEEESEKINVEPECPFDQSIMRPVLSPVIPSSVRIFFCPICHGNWFPRAELVRFKKNQEKKILDLKTFNMPLKSISAIFLPVLFVGFMFGSMLLARQSFLSPSPQNVTVGASTFYKLLQVKIVSPSSVEISYYTDEPTKATLLYKNINVDAVMSESETQYSRYHFFALKNLVSPENYLFQITSVGLSYKNYESEWMSAK